MFEKEPANWRELLGQITSDPAEMQRIVQELGVRDITVKRWVKGESEPRSHNLHGLIHALPAYREYFVGFFSDAFEDFSEVTLDAPQQEIPPRFYKQIFQMRGTISRSQRYWTLANTIISQAIAQLDPENLGLAIWVSRCMCHEQAGKILSLRQSVGQGSGHWPGNLEQRAMFLGAESLAGYSLENCRPSEVPNYKEDQTALLGNQLDREASAIAHPILYAGLIAGCLIFSSAEPYFFAPPARQNLVSDYAHLIALAFDTEDFIELSQIELRTMPSHNEQKTYFANFSKRLADARVKLYEQKSDRDAELYVWEELEREILHL